MKKVKLLVLSAIMIISLILLAGCEVDWSDPANAGITGSTTEEVGETDDFMNDNDSYFFIIDGKKFFAGDKISDLSSVGYNLKSTEADEEIPANKYIIGAGTMMNSADEWIFNVTPFNPTNAPVKVSDALIGGVDISDAWAEDDPIYTNFEVYGGIKPGSTREEVEKVFGEPSMIVGDEPEVTYKYDSDEVYRSFKFHFNEEGKVSDIEWKNLVFADKK